MPAVRKCLGPKLNLKLDGYYFKHEIMPMAIRPSLHVDTFSRQNLPPESQWPLFEFLLQELEIADPFNCGAWLLDRALSGKRPDSPAIFHNGITWTYADLAAKTNQICHALVEDLHVVSGNRVLLRGANSPMMFAAWLAVMKIGAIAVSTMPLLRSRELEPIVAKADIQVAICAQEIATELEALVGSSPLKKIVTYGDDSAALERIMQPKAVHFDAIATSQDDVCIIAFTSGTTGRPKATMHFHRDVLAMCETFAKHMVPADKNSIFSGTPPIGFTFGLGGLLVFPLYFGAAMALPAGPSPLALTQAIEQYRVTHLFTSPTGYKALASKKTEYDLSSLKAGVSAGEPLSREISDLWKEATGIRLIDGIGSTEMIHCFISATGDKIRPGATGKPVPGYRAELFDENFVPIAGPGTGRLGVRGPTGCRYLSDSRQLDYVVNGWNITGDIYRRDEDGYYWFVARSDDMIVSSGYNIAGPEVELALAQHPHVEECAVIGWPDPDRGQIVKAVVVPKPGIVPTADLAKTLQEHVKATLAPYKYPRAIEFRTSLPKTATGKLQRSALKSAS